MAEFTQHVIQSADGLSLGYRVYRETRIACRSSACRG